MPKRLTKEEFIKRSTESRGGVEYNYSLTEFTGTKGSVTVICDRGHKFRQIVNDHLRGGKCPFCQGTQMNTETFIEKANKVHNFSFDYSKSVFKRSDEKVVITCANNHTFWQRPNCHLSGKGCKDCAVVANAAKQRKSQYDYLEQAKKNHTEAYDYSLFEYLGDNCYGIFICPNGHKYEQLARNHAKGIGCPCCCESGYRINKPGHFYVMINGDITKIGITNRTPDIRVSEINKEKPGFELAYSKLFSNGKVALALETSLLWILKSEYLQVDEKFDGSTECFLNVDRNQLIYIATKSGENLERYADDH